jgi:hypothetical protein
VPFLLPDYFLDFARCLPHFIFTNFSDGGESARWGLVFRVLEQQQQAIRALQQQLKANP